MILNNAVSVVIPVFNQWTFTKKTLETLFADPFRPSLQVIVVDNGSTDGTHEHLKEYKKNITHHRDSLTVITNEKNLGVAPAWNQGVTAATEKYVAVLNNDLALTPGWLQGCLWALHYHELAMVSPFAGTGELNYDLSCKSKIFTLRNKEKLWKTYDFCAVVFFKKTLEDFGSFDENFLVGGYEDTDYAYRLKQGVLQFGVTGAAYIHHFGSQTLGEFKKRGDQHAAHNKNYFMEKWGEDPSHYAASWSGKVQKRIRKLKLRCGFM